MNRHLGPILLAALACSWIPTPLAAQEPAPMPPSPEKPIPRDQLLLQYHPVTSGYPGAVQGLAGAVERAFGRQILTEDGRRSNVFTVGSSIAVLETRDRMAEIMKSLPAMEQAFLGGRGQEAVEEFQTTIVPLKHAPVGDVMPLLKVFERSVPGPGGGGDSTGNIRLLESRNAIVVHETAKITARIKDLLAAIDQHQAEPALPTVYTLDIQVLRVAAEAPKGDAAPAADLADNLRRLGPWKHFEVLGTGLLRIGTNPGNASLRMDLGAELSAQLSIQGLAPSGKDSGSVSVQRCQLEIQSSPRPGEAPPSPTMIQTSTQLTAGQYTVIGAAGRMPFLLVIRATS